MGLATMAYNPDMALWPPSLINCTKSSLSAGAFKVSDLRTAPLQIKKLTRTEESRKHNSFLVEDKRDMPHTVCCGVVFIIRTIAISSVTTCFCSVANHLIFRSKKFGFSECSRSFSK